MFRTCAIQPALAAVVSARFSSIRVARERQVGRAWRRFPVAQPPELVLPFGDRVRLRRRDSRPAAAGERQRRFGRLLLLVAQPSMVVELRRRVACQSSSIRVGPLAVGRVRRELDRQRLLLVCGRLAVARRSRSPTSARFASSSSVVRPRSAAARPAAAPNCGSWAARRGPRRATGPTACRRKARPRSRRVTSPVSGCRRASSSLRGRSASRSPTAAARAPRRAQRNVGDLPHDDRLQVRMW